ncbi:MAG TPA: enoyl-CoA hydratase/isomerase family protein [Acidimicrobiales bacterium]|nr:enoyl-CoA hydratase/isomerase family protein [Acidimicrobiales bacterium]
MATDPRLSPRDYGEFEHLSFDRRRNGVVVVTLDRPDVLNAANVRMHHEMGAVWAVLDADPDARVAVVTGAGRAFSAGGDLDMIEEMIEDYEALLAQWHDARAVVEKMLAAEKPIVSAINGVAVGAGLAVALLADVSIMGSTARISDGHARLGVAAGDHAALLWPLLCGMAKAKYYLMTADFVDGPEAERIGLVTRCVADDDVVPQALAIADRLAAGSATAVQWTKRVMNQWLVQALPAFGESVALEMLGFLGPDAREGLAAIRERRDPAFPSAPPHPAG